MSDPALPKPNAECKKCKSPRMVHVRLDSDWGHGGDVSRLNGDSYYKSEDLDDDRPDINIDVCLECGHEEGWR
jgi:hypothetical protein